MATLLLYAPSAHLRAAKAAAIAWRSAGRGPALVRDAAGLVDRDQVERADVVRAHPQCLEQVQRFYPTAEPWGTDMDSAVGGAPAAKDGSIANPVPAKSGRGRLLPRADD